MLRVSVFVKARCFACETRCFAYVLRVCASRRREGFPSLPKTETRSIASLQ
ncbi:MAG: hypothetical protein VSS75_033185 [Candidatus Parabeggiatoa sp.]|nr:hypothetical protein [Candidatus Parabeggiatoa sp.]